MFQVMDLQSRLKFSKYERDLSLFILNYRNKDVGDSVKPFYTTILDTKGKISDVHEWSSEVFKYRGDAYSFRELSDWKIPKFPINGHILAERGYKPGPKMSKIMSELKHRWIQSNFQLTKEDLLQNLGKDT